jgi:hypothetical protein
VRLASYLLVLVLALEVAVGEAFLVAARPFGEPLPVAALAAVVGNVALGRLGARVLGRPAPGAAGPGLVWLVAALALGSGAPGGDRVVPGTGRGLAFLVAGAAAAAGVVAVTAGKNGASPGAAARR